MEKQLKKLKIKVLIWWIFSFSSIFIMLAALVSGIVALIIQSDALGAVSMLIGLPLLMSLGFIIGHSVNLNNKKEVLICYLENPNTKPKLFYSLIEKYLSGEIKQVFKKLNLKKTEVSFAVLKDKKMYFAVSGIKDKFYIHIEFNKTYFSFYADIDEEEEEIKVQYPKTDSITDLIELVNNELEKEIKRKNGIE